jgi:hypothetical protein
VLAWSAIPIGTLAGGYLIERTGKVALVYGAIGVLVIAVALLFSMSPVGHAERYLDAEAQTETEAPSGQPA